MSKSVLMTVANSGYSDVRVVREAESLVAKGIKVTVMGYKRGATTADMRELNGVHYIHLEDKPVSSIRQLILVIGALISLGVTRRLVGLLCICLVKYSVEVPYFFLKIIFSQAVSVLRSNIGLNLRAAVVIIILFVLALGVISLDLDLKTIGVFLLGAFSARGIFYFRKFIQGIHAAVGESSIFGSYPKLLYYFSVNLPAVLKGAQYDVLHAHDLNALWPTYITGKVCDLPIFFDAHELASHENGKEKRLNTAFKRILLDRIVLKLSGVVTVSEFFAEIFRNNYGAKATAVYYNSPITKSILAEGQNAGVDGKSLRQDACVQNDNPLIIHVGGINHRRGSRELGAVIGNLPQQYTFVFVTNSKAEVLNEIINIAQETSGGKPFAQVVVLPAVSQEILIRYISEADISVITRLPPLDYFNPQREYALPNKLFESMFARLPMVLGDCAANRYIAERFGIAEVQDIRKAKDFSRTIQEVYENSERYMYTQKLKEELYDTFSIDTSENNLINLYNTEAFKNA